MTGNDTAKPLRADARRNRELVLSAARVAFAEEGVTVPLDEIARRAGVGADTVYRHFPTKHALFAAIVAGTIRDGARRARELAHGDDPAAGLSTFFGEMVDQGRDNRAIADALGGAEAEAWRDGLVSVGDSMLAALTDLLDHAQRTGKVRADLTAEQVKALLVGVLAASDWLGGDVAQRRQLADVVCAGFRADPAS